MVDARSFAPPGPAAAAGATAALPTSHAVQSLMDALAARLGFDVEPAQSRQRTVLRLASGARIAIEPWGDALLLQATFPVASRLPRHLLDALQRLAAFGTESVGGRNRDASGATDALRRLRSGWSVQVAAQTMQDAAAREDALIVLVRLRGTALQLEEAEAALRFLHGWRPHAMP